MEYAVVITPVERKSVTNQYEIECELRVFANLSLPFFHRGIQLAIAAYHAATLSLFVRFQM